MKTVTVTTSSTQVAEANCPFVHVYVESVSVDGAACHFCYDGGSAATVADGMPVYAGQYLSNNDGGIRQILKYPIYAIVASGTATLKVQGSS